MTLDYDEFLAEVQRDAELPRQQDAIRAIRAALETLAERLSGDEARDFARHLPEPVRPWLHDGEVAEPFGVEEYLERLAERESVDEGEAVRHAVAVFAALRRATGPDELRRLESELPKDFRSLLAAAGAAVEPDGGPPPAETFILRVVAYGALDLSSAWAAAEAVLEVLGERLSAGEAEDLAARLPDELAEWLRRGERRTNGRAASLDVEAFVERVAEREDVSPAAARRHVRAVLLAVRDVAGERELDDALAQLPRAYRSLLRNDGDAERRSRRGRMPDLSAAPLTPETVELHAPDDLPDAAAAATRARMASLQRFTDAPLLNARLTLRRPRTHASRVRWVADASILLDGRLLAAHATGPSPLAAADTVVERLRRQIRRAAGAEIALRNEPRVIARALRDLPNELGHRATAEVLPTKPGDRRLVHRIVRPPLPVSLADAAADLVDRDWEFRLFLEQNTGEWLFLHRRDDDRLGLMHPPSVPVPDVAEDVMVVEPMRFSDPLALEEAQELLEQLGARYLYFVDAADGRPKVLYLRHDGDLGLMEPEREAAEPH